MKAVFALFLFFLLSGCIEKVSTWEEVKLADQPVIEAGWSAPMEVGVNTLGWEDSSFISGDGQTLYFSYYPGDLLGDIGRGKTTDDIDMYVSEYPFETKTKHPVSEDIWSEVGSMVSGEDLYYNSNKVPIETLQQVPPNDNIYQNDEKLPFNVDTKAESDPHYCAAKDELYYWQQDDGGSYIYVYKNNTSSLVPSPINQPGTGNLQPFLTPDCQTMYFTSAGRENGIIGIYRSQRAGEDSWSQPSRVMYAPRGLIGEPTLTDDGKTLFFVHVFKNEAGEQTSDIFYVERES